MDNVFSALQIRLANIHTVANQYADDILYIVTSPEFGLNGWKDNPGANGIKKWNASGAFPQSLEAYIRDRVCVKLASDPFIHFHILFIFSCFTHSTNNMVPQVALNGQQRIVANNRLNIVCRKSATPDPLKFRISTVTKFENSPVDSVPIVFTAENGWNDNTGAMIFGTLTRSRDVETKFQLLWTDADNDPVILGLGTCQDVRVDKHPTNRMVIFCGLGTPFMRKPDVEGLPMPYPFLLNDSQSWSVTPPALIKAPNANPTAGGLRKDQLQAAGYYQFSNAPPAPGAQSVAQTFADIWEAGLTSQSVLHSEKDRPSMAQCYFHPTPHESDPASFTTARTHQTPILVSTTAVSVPLFKYTDPVALPDMHFN